MTLVNCLNDLLLTERIMEVGKRKEGRGKGRERKGGGREERGREGEGKGEEGRGKGRKKDRKERMTEGTRKRRSHKPGVLAAATSSSWAHQALECS